MNIWELKRNSISAEIFILVVRICRSRLCLSSAHLQSKQGCCEFRPAHTVKPRLERELFRREAERARRPRSLPVRVIRTSLSGPQIRAIWRRLKREQIAVMFSFHFFVLGAFIWKASWIAPPHYTQNHRLVRALLFFDVAFPGISQTLEETLLRSASWRRGGRDWHRAGQDQRGGWGFSLRILNAFLFGYAYRLYQWCCCLKQSPYLH